MPKIPVLTSCLYLDYYMALVAGGEKRKDVSLRYGSITSEEYKCAGVADLPRVIKGGIGFKGREGRPMVCGGVGGGKRSQASKTCFVYQKANNSWVEGPSLIEARAGADAVTMVDGNTWIFGGRR